MKRTRRKAFISVIIDVRIKHIKSIDIPEGTHQFPLPFNNGTGMEPVWKPRGTVGINKELFETQFPADFISEAVDQTRGWFYSLLAISTLIFNKAPYKNVIVLGHVQDENGQKMSKSKGNAVDPFEALEKHGADAIGDLTERNQCGIKRHISINLILRHSLDPKTLTGTADIPVA